MKIPVAGAADATHPLTTTTCHPLQVNGGKPTENEAASRTGFTTVNAALDPPNPPSAVRARRSKKLNGIVALRLTAEEERSIGEAAKAQGITKSAWLRRTVLEAVACPPAIRLVLTEVLAVRALAIALHSAAHPGTDAVIRSAINVADGRKQTDAEARLQALSHQK